MTKLALRRCTPVKKGSKPISPGIARSLLNQINNKWRLDPQAKFVEREFEFADFRRTIEFVNAVAWIANGQDHHPDLEISYNCCKVRFTTHAAGGLTVNDFICAAKVDALFSEEMLKSASPSPTKRPHPPAPVAIDENSSNETQETATQDSIQLSDLSLDSQEVEELLNKKLPDEEDEPTSPDLADEFELFDPETVSPPAPPQEAPAPTKEQPQTPATAKESPAIIEDSHADPGLTSTVILPPGMQAVGNNPADEDEDATVILPENTAIDPEETVVGAQNKLPTPSPGIEDDDEVKTVILNPTLTTRTEEETVILPPDPPAPGKPENPKPPTSGASVSLPPISPKKDDDEVGTMILSSNPLNHPNLKKSETAEDANKQSAMTEKQTPNTPSKPPVAEEEPDFMGTMVLSPAEIEALNRKQAEKKQTGEKNDEDDTLVMHVNDFKKLKNDQH